jgi:hypothetical protein
MSILTIDEEMGCCDCSRLLPIGSPYSLRLLALDDSGDTLSDVLCVYCSLEPARYAADLDPSELLD